MTRPLSTWFILVPISACSPSSTDDTLDLDPPGGTDSSLGEIEPEDGCDGYRMITVVGEPLPAERQALLNGASGTRVVDGTWNNGATVSLTISATFDIANVVHEFHSDAEGAPVPGCVSTWAVPIQVSVVSDDGELDLAFSNEFKGSLFPATLFSIFTTADIGPGAVTMLPADTDNVMFSAGWNTDEVSGEVYGTSGGNNRRTELLSF